MLKGKRKLKGFTLIELMVVIVVIGILVSIALPNFIAAQDRARVSNVKSNMKLFQGMVSTYSIDWGGVYPTTCTNLNTEALQKGYWKDFKNPFSGLTGFNLSYKDQTTTLDTNTGAGTIDSGIVAYEGIGTPTSKFYLYGGSSKLNTAIIEKGNTFYLTNN